MLVQPTPVAELPVIEVFSSIQGEGPWVGCRQVFVRLAECNLKCRYCDTPTAPPDVCRIETLPGTEEFKTLPNPVPVDVLFLLLRDWAKETPGLHHSISLTGGEPLVHSDALTQVLPALRDVLPVYLETNGTLPEALEPLLPHLDFISMDLKLPSVAGVTPQWEDHRQFLRLGWNLPGYVKVVVSEQTCEEELEEAATLVAEEAENKDLILQPITLDNQPGVSGQRMHQFQEVAARVYPRVRVIPQVHPILGAL